jgi:flagellar M-ring protein FliF
MNMLEQIRAVWQRIGLVQRALLLAVGMTFAVVVGLVVHWSRQPEMRLLYQELAPDEASKITEKIAEQGVAYELRSGGTSIYAPREHIYQLRLDMAKEGLPSGEQSGYKLFDNESIGTSPFVQSVNLKRALQDELAKSIQMIDGVGYARVHIVRSEQTLFTSDARTTTASVVLRLKPGHRPSALNIGAITHLVAGSVEGLKPENVTVIDNQGHLLSGEVDSSYASGATTVQDYRERVEENLAQKVEEMLETVLGPGRATVKVSAVIDMNTINTVVEKLEPKGVAVKEEIKESSKTEGGSSGEGGGMEKDSTTISEFAFGKMVETRVELPGRIESLSVAAFVDLTVEDANAAEGGAEATMIMSMADVEEAIRNALGLKETDVLKVVNAKFYRQSELLTDEEEASSWPRYVAIARQASLGVMGICALLALRILGGGKKKAKKGEVVGALPAAGEGAGLLPAGGGGGETVMVRAQIASALKNDPEAVKQLFTSWLEQKEG